MKFHTPWPPGSPKIAHINLSTFSSIIHTRWAGQARWFGHFLANCRRSSGEALAKRVDDFRSKRIRKIIDKGRTLQGLQAKSKYFS